MERTISISIPFFDYEHQTLNKTTIVEADRERKEKRGKRKIEVFFFQINTNQNDRTKRKKKLLFLREEEKKHWNLDTDIDIDTDTDIDTHTHTLGPSNHRIPYGTFLSNFFLLSIEVKLTTVVWKSKGKEKERIKRRIREDARIRFVSKLSLGNFQKKKKLEFNENVEQNE